MAFFDNYGIDYSAIIDHTDGVYNGNLLEFKLNITNLNKVLFHAIKYLSKMRIKGESVPATILLIDLNNTKVYLYKSQDYFEYIHKIYIGAASKNNDNFIANEYNACFDYSLMVDSDKVKHILKDKKTDSEKYIPIEIDENCIIGWAKRYYKENPTASKGDFIGDDNGTQVKVIGEIRNPKQFRNLILPYTKRTNEKFRYLMDCLNDRLSKKDLGAFYTPMPYAEKAAELVKKAVERVPEGNDYIILDRCAGTGNLEVALIGLKDKNGDDLISHCIVATYEYYEYKVLSERVGDLVRHIIPPTEGDVDYESGKIRNADALSEEFINNAIIKKYIDNSKCSIILFENPPYRDMTVDNTKHAKRKNKDKEHLCQKCKKELKSVTSNDLVNIFIWSGFKLYLRQNTDSYIVFSPIKYWKCDKFVKKHFINGYIFNRKHFHATAAAVTCILWSNKNDENAIKLDLAVFDIKDGKLYDNKIILNVKQVSYRPSKGYDKKTYCADIENGICCSLDGTEYMNDVNNIRVKKLFSEDIIGYMTAKSYHFGAMNRFLARCAEYDANGCFIRASNYLSLLPLWVAKLFPLQNWYEKGIICTTYDGGNIYKRDMKFLKSCMLYSCLSRENKCLSFTGSDGRYYRNELCFDNTNGNTVAYKDLINMYLDDDEAILLTLWNNILQEAKKTKAYNPKLTYGVYQITKELNTKHINELSNSRQQITKELNTKHIDESNSCKQNSNPRKQKKMIPDYPVLNGYLDTLRIKLKEYYKSHITEKMFKYQLLK